MTNRTEKILAMATKNNPNEIIRKDAQNNPYEFRKYETSGYMHDISQDTVDNMKTTIAPVLSARRRLLPSEPATHTQSTEICNKSKSETTSKTKIPILPARRRLFPSEPATHTQSTEICNKSKNEATSKTKIPVLPARRQLFPSEPATHTQSTEICNNSKNEATCKTKIPVLPARRRLFPSDPATHTQSTEICNKSKNETTSKTKSKQNFCFYCHRLVCKIARHLELLHSEEKDVREFTCLRKGSKKRKLIIEKIRKNGDYIYNTNTQHRTASNDIIVCRKPQNNKKRDRNYYKVCPNCKGFYSSIALRKHFRKCSQTKNTSDRNLLIQSKKTYSDIHYKASETLKNEIFPVLREDNVTGNLRFDELAIIYGNKLCIKYRSKHHHNMIRSRLRLIGRFMLEIKKINPNVIDFASIFDPSIYDDVIKAINIVAQLDEINGKYKSPSTAFALGTSLKLNANLMILECIKTGDKVKKKLANDFLKLMCEDLSTSINKTVSENQLEYKRQKKVILPSNEDIKLLNTYLAKKRKESFIKLNKKFSFEAWKNLASLTLISIQVFNRRRPGEIERAQISDFNAYECVNRETDPEIYNSLSCEAQKAATRYIRFQIRGKLARGVPVLLHTELVEYVKLLIKLRKEAKISDENPYIFALPGNANRGHLNANKLMRDYSTLCGAKNPSVLRATHLRKHVATQSVLLNLQDNEVTDLANFLGHAEKIHREHYRLPIATREIAQMSRLLELAQGKDGESDEESLHEENVAEVEKEHEERSPLLFHEENFVEIDKEHEEMSHLDVVNITQEKRNEQEETNNIRTSSLTRRNTRRLEVSSDSESSDKENTESASRQKTTPKHNEKRNVQDERNCVTPPRITQRDTRRLEDLSDSESSNTDTSLRQKTSPKCNDSYVRYIRRKSWSTPEKHSARKLLLKYSARKSLPSFNECQEFISSHQSLQNRTANQLKAWLQNQKNLAQKPKNKQGKSSWSTPERHAVRKVFGAFIEEKKIPSIPECKNCIQQNKVLSKRTPVILKAYVYNEIQRRKRD